MVLLPANQMYAARRSQCHQIVHRKERGTWLSLANVACNWSLTLSWSLQSCLHYRQTGLRVLLGTHRPHSWPADYCGVLCPSVSGKRRQEHMLLGSLGKCLWHICQRQLCLSFDFKEAFQYASSNGRRSAAAPQRPR